MVINTTARTGCLPGLALAILALAVVPAPLDAHEVQPRRLTKSQLPTCNSAANGITVTITDPLTSADCDPSTSTGTAEAHHCICNGSTGEWEFIAGQDLDLVDDAIIWTDPAQTVIHIGSTSGQMTVESMEVERPYILAVHDGRARTGDPCDSTFCAGANKCNEGGSDCTDDDTLCISGLFCREDVGEFVGCSGTDDVCLPTDYWCAASCSPAMPCRAGRGDCAGDDSACAAGLECRVDAGADWSCGSTVDICESPAATVCDVSCDGCLTAGQGDCTATGDNDCGIGLTCTGFRGAYYGCAHDVSICE